jgi:two-component system, chemotaxis family, CheB/CheR fusion protein
MGEDFNTRPEQADSAPQVPGAEPEPEETSGAQITPLPRSASGEDEPVVVADKSEEEADEAAPLPFLVVGIGASAGGVEAYIELFQNLASDTGMVFVVIPHLMATQKSHLVEILARTTSMPVSEIVEGARPEPDHVYILPPNARARLEQGVLRLDNRSVDRIPRPIDFFFRSLAAAQKTRAVGVVLS